MDFHSLTSHIPRLQFFKTLPDGCSSYRGICSSPPIYCSVQDILDDFRLIFDNCILYNGKNHTLSKLGEQLRKFVVQRLEEGADKGLFDKQAVDDFKHTTDENLDAAQLMSADEIKSILDSKPSPLKVQELREARLKEQRSGKANPPSHRSLHPESDELPLKEKTNSIKDLSASQAHSLHKSKLQTLTKVLRRTEKDDDTFVYYRSTSLIISSLRDLTEEDIDYIINNIETIDQSMMSLLISWIETELPHDNRLRTESTDVTFAIEEFTNKQLHIIFRYIKSCIDILQR